LRVLWIDGFRVGRSRNGELVVARMVVQFSQRLGSGIRQEF
jgi:hypothetical protein